MTKPSPAPSALPVFTVNFVGTLGFSIVLPFLVFLVEDLGGNALVYGLVGATYPAMQLLGAPVLGRWSDTIGRKKVLLLSQAGTLLSWLIFIAALALPAATLLEVDSTALGQFSLTLPLLVVFVARGLDGLTGGNVSVANAYLADITPEDQRKKAFARMAISANLGFILGPVLAGLLGATAWGNTLPVIAAAVISLVATVLIAFALPESKPAPLETSPEDEMCVRRQFGNEVKDPIQYCHEPQPPTFMQVLKRPHVLIMLALNFVIFLGFNLFYTSFPVHAVHGLGWNVTQTGIFFAVLSLQMVAVQGPLMQKFGDRFSDAGLVIGGNVILAGSFVLFARNDSVAIYVGTALFALGNGTMWPSMLSLISRVAGDDMQGAVQGFASSVSSAASIAGLILGGILYEGIGSATFYGTAALIALAALASLALPRIERRLDAVSSDAA